MKRWGWSEPFSLSPFCLTKVMVINEKEQSSDLNIQHVFLWYMEEGGGTQGKTQVQGPQVFPPRWNNYIKMKPFLLRPRIKHVVTVAVATYYVDNLFIYFRKTTRTCQCRKWPKSARTNIKSYPRSGKPNSSPGKTKNSKYCYDSNKNNCAFSKKKNSFRHY